MEENKEIPTDNMQLDYDLMWVNSSVQISLCQATKLEVFR